MLTLETEKARGGQADALSVEFYAHLITLCRKFAPGLMQFMSPSSSTWCLHQHRAAPLGQPCLVISAGLRGEMITWCSHAVTFHCFLITLAFTKLSGRLPRDTFSFTPDNPPDSHIIASNCLPFKEVDPLVASTTVLFVLTCGGSSKGLGFFRIICLLLFACSWPRCASGKLGSIFSCFWYYLRMS